ncbi:hypothetical protein [Sphingomonas sp. 22176]|uniref:hypothetical protein n=1 Tax=Sphingomonas sp. 22176 TaxID=3453884 RepID=UPI003F83D599
MTRFVRYDPSLEQSLEDEEALMRELETMMVDLARLVHEKHGHAFHGTHAKLTGLMTGMVEVLPDLPPELAQGMFATRRSYEAVVRLAPGAPEPLTDKASGQRGLSIKVIGVEGERLPGFGETASQDWVLGLDPAFTAATARDFLRTFRYTGAQSPHLPEPAIVALSRAARGVEAAQVFRPLPRTSLCGALLHTGGGTVRRLCRQARGDPVCRDACSPYRSRTAGIGAGCVPRCGVRLHRGSPGRL